MLRNNSLSPSPAIREREEWKYTAGISFLGVGVSEANDRFLKVAVGNKTALLNVDHIANSHSVELKILTRLGMPLIMPAARAEFLRRAQVAARQEPTFAVVTKTGWHGDVFVLPEGLAQKAELNIERYFDPRYEQYHRRLQRAGTPKGWLQLAESCRGKTRLVAALCLNFTGPVCAAFGLEPPALQFTSKGGLGKTTIGRVAATVWGGDKNLARKLGCGVAWNNTACNLEVVATAFNQMSLYLDDMHKATKEDVEAIIELMNGEGRGRSTEVQRVDYCTSIVSTSNTSAIAIAQALKISRHYEALIDRVVDIDLPKGSPYFFEGVNTVTEFRTYGHLLRTLSRENFGLAGPEFTVRLAREMKADRALVQAFVEERQQTYWNAAVDIKSGAGRDLTRLSDKFATIYIAGCLAIRFKILPFTEAEALAALITCQRDHVAFIDRELGVHVPNVIASTSTIAPGALVSSSPASMTPFDRIKKYLNAALCSGGFVDLRSDPPTLPIRGAPHGFIAIHHGREEYWLTDTQFVAIAGGATEARALKRQLAARSLIEVGGGKRDSYVVKRQVPGGGREWFVVIRGKPISSRTTDRTRQGGPTAGRHAKRVAIPGAVIGLPARHNGSLRPNRAHWDKSTIADDAAC
jgi:putative DNA primase/helicase